MAYDESFYKAYTEYLQEPTVREAHDWVFGLIKEDYSFDNVVDFGCGRSQEFYNHYRPRYYLGVDENLDDNLNEPGFRFALLKEDYRAKTNWEGMRAFVSLFSCEITAPVNENYIYYMQLFKDTPSLGAGLVSGFYYAKRMGSNPVKEAGGLLSWQTLEPINYVKNTVFSEKRIYMPVPSKMFGDDVVEVWKIFTRNDPQST